MLFFSPRCTLKRKSRFRKPLCLASAFYAVGHKVHAHSTPPQRPKCVTDRQNHSSIPEWLKQERKCHLLDLYRRPTKSPLFEFMSDSSGKFYRTAQLHGVAMQEVCTFISTKILPHKSIEQVHSITIYRYFPNVCSSIFQLISEPLAQKT